MSFSDNAIRSEYGSLLELRGDPIDRRRFKTRVKDQEERSTDGLGQILGDFVKKLLGPAELGVKSAAIQALCHTSTRPP